MLGKDVPPVEERAETGYLYAIGIRTASKEDRGTTYMSLLPNTTCRAVHKGLNQIVRDIEATWHCDTGATDAHHSFRQLQIPGSTRDT